LTPLPPPWTIEETDSCFIVKEHAGLSLAYVYFEEEPGRHYEMTRYGTLIAWAKELGHAECVPLLHQQSR
jgi:ferritin-like metal-binding protein YciE